MKHRSLFLLVPFLCAPFVFAQRSQPSPGVGNAVLLGLDSFTFAVSNGIASSSALAKIIVFLKGCAHDVSGCFNGR
jgi:hypothetical protein